MAERNPFIPSERRQEMEERTRFNEEEANRRYARKWAALKEAAGMNAAQQAASTKEVGWLDQEEKEEEEEEPGL